MPLFCWHKTTFRVAEVQEDIHSDGLKGDPVNGQKVLWIALDLTAHMAKMKIDFFGKLKIDLPQNLQKESMGWSICFPNI